MFEWAIGRRPQIEVIAGSQRYFDHWVQDFEVSRVVDHQTIRLARLSVAGVRRFVEVERIAKALFAAAQDLPRIQLAATLRSQHWQLYFSTQLVCALLPLVRLFGVNVSSHDLTLNRTPDSETKSTTEGGNPAPALWTRPSDDHTA